MNKDPLPESKVNEMVRRVEGELGPVSLLVNNAGVAGQALFQDITDALWHRYFAVNVDGAFHTIQPKHRSAAPKPRRPAW